MYFNQTDPTVIRWIKQLQDSERARLAAETRALVAEQNATEERRRREAAERKAEESLFDPVTGLRNRLALDAYISIVYPAAIRTGIPLTALYVDANGLKEVNDKIGHAAGNEYLSSLGKAFNAGRRETDGVFRIGGDEFLIILPGCQEPEEGAKVGQQILATLRDNPCKLETKEGAIERVPGASIGVATLNTSKRETSEALITRGDELMYHAKQIGKTKSPRESLVCYCDSKSGERILLSTPPKLDPPLQLHSLIIPPQPASPTSAVSHHIEPQPIEPQLRPVLICKPLTYKAA